MAITKLMSNTAEITIYIININDAINAPVGSKHLFSQFSSLSLQFLLQFSSKRSSNMNISPKIDQYPRFNTRLTVFKLKTFAGYNMECIDTENAHINIATIITKNFKSSTLIQIKLRIFNKFKFKLVFLFIITIFRIISNLGPIIKINLSIRQDQFNG